MLRLENNINAFDLRIYNETLLEIIWSNLLQFRFSAGLHFVLVRDIEQIDFKIQRKWYFGEHIAHLSARRQFQLLRNIFFFGSVLFEIYEI